MYHQGHLPENPNFVDGMTSVLRDAKEHDHRVFPRRLEQNAEMRQNMLMVVSNLDDELENQRPKEMS